MVFSARSSIDLCSQTFPAENGLSSLVSAIPSASHSSSTHLSCSRLPSAHALAHQQPRRAISLLSHHAPALAERPARALITSSFLAFPNPAVGDLLADVDRHFGVPTKDKPRTKHHIEAANLALSLQGDEDLPTGDADEDPITPDDEQELQLASML